MSADNVALPASRRAAANDRRPAGRAAIDRYLLGAGPTAANPQQRRAAAGWDRQTDARQLHRPCCSCCAGYWCCTSVSSLAECTSDRWSRRYTDWNTPNCTNCIDESLTRTWSVSPAPVHQPINQFSQQGRSQAWAWGGSSPPRRRLSLSPQMKTSPFNERANVLAAAMHDYAYTRVKSEGLSSYHCCLM